jgi:hypothetical protein
VSERHLRYRLAADTSINLLQQAEDVISSFRVPAAVRRKMDRDRSSLVRDYANVFRLLEEQDGYEWPEITYALNWLFTRSDWLRNGYIASINSLRAKTRSGEQTKFESILTQALSDDGYTGPEDARDIGSKTERDNERRDENLEERFERIYAIASRAVRAG